MTTTVTTTIDPFTWHRGAELEGVQFWWRDSDDELHDLSGSTFEVRVGKIGSPALLEKTAGITGAVGSGTPSDGTPNLQIDWAIDELDLPAGKYSMLVIATDFDGRDRRMAQDIRILDIVQPAA